jgi:hypothetical protein
MNAFLIFAGLTVGLLVAAGPDAFVWPSRWVAEGLHSAGAVQPALACAVAAMQERRP